MLVFVLKISIVKCFIYYSIGIQMMKFFYDSLETLQKVKFASKKDYISLGLGVVFMVIVFGAFFVGVDTLVSGAYRTFYSAMRSGVDIQDNMGTGIVTDLSGNNIVISTGEVAPSVDTGASTWSL